MPACRRSRATTRSTPTPRRCSRTCRVAPDRSADADRGHPLHRRVEDLHLLAPRPRGEPQPRRDLDAADPRRARRRHRRLRRAGERSLRFPPERAVRDHHRHLGLWPVVDRVQGRRHQPAAVQRAAGQAVLSRDARVLGRWASRATSSTVACGSTSRRSTASTRTSRST